MPILDGRVPCLVAVLAMAACSGSEPHSDPADAGAPDSAAPIAACAIDVHQHISGQAELEPAAIDLISHLDASGIARALLMPPPQAAGENERHTLAELQAVAGAHAERIAIIGGGGTLNPMIHASALSGSAPTAGELGQFAAAADAIADAGVAGFGELAALHLSFQPWHPFIEIAPDHPMLLRLAEVAAERDLPIDLHMELVDETMATPAGLPQPPAGNNPDTLTGNRSGFEALLAHAPSARIVWAHVGWDHIGDATIEALAGLLDAHPNLYLQLHAVPDPAAGAAELALLDADGTLRPDWRALIEASPDRFVLGGDEFFTDGVAPRVGAGGTAATWSLVDQLPADVARQIACDNPQRIYRLDSR